MSMAGMLMQERRRKLIWSSDSIVLACFAVSTGLAQL
jgi:hypothetical protein